MDIKRKRRMHRWMSEWVDERTVGQLVEGEAGWVVGCMDGLKYRWKNRHLNGLAEERCGGMVGR